MQLFSGCSLGAKASALGAEDRGFKSLHPDFGFRGGGSFIRAEGLIPAVSRLRSRRGC